MSLPLDGDFEQVTLEGWQVAAAKAGGAEPVTLPGGGEVRRLYVRGDRSRELPGRPGTPPFLRGASFEPGWQIAERVFGDTPERLQERVSEAVAGGVERVHLGPEQCATLGDSDLDAGSATLVFRPWPEAVDALRERFVNAEVAVDPLASHLARNPLGLQGSADVPDRAALGRDLAPAAAARRGRAIHVDVRPYVEAGAEPASEVALALATATEYLRALVEAEHPLADAPLRLRFGFSASPDLFVTLAKLRAARLAWSMVLRALGIDGPEQGLRMFVSPALRHQSALEPVTNALRATSAAIGAIAGGADEVLLDAFDGLGAEGSPRARRLARNTHLILEAEAHLGRVMDPGGGSYYVEALTEQIAEQAWQKFRAIEAPDAGLLSWLSDGTIAKPLARHAALERAAVRSAERGLVGVNRYAHVPDEDGEPDDSPDELAPETPRAEDAVVASRPAEVFERLRARASQIAAKQRRAVVIAVGEPRKAAAAAQAARDRMTVIGLLVDVRPPAERLTDAFDALETPPAVLVVVGAFDADELAALEQRVAVLVTVGPAEDDAEDDGEGKLVSRPGGDLVTLGERILAALEEAAS